MPSLPTLYEDWQLRRERLLKTGAPLGQAYVDVQIHILDYLIDRYRDTPESEQPPRFPYNSETFFNDRAIVVHHHLGRGTSQIKNAAEARTKASSILKRISAKKPQEDAHAPEGTGYVADAYEKFRTANWNFFDDKSRTQKAWLKIGQALQLGLDVEARIAEALDCSPMLPETAVSWLFERVQESRMFAVKYLERCNNSSIVNYAAIAWSDHLMHTGPCGLTDALGSIFRQPQRQSQAAERIRAELANDSPTVRLEALKLLNDIGTVDDVGLLSDLLALPTQKNEEPGEREALMKTMRALSECGRFNVIPAKTS